MSEKLHTSGEHLRTHETAHSNEAIKDKIEAGKHARHEHADAVESIRRVVEQEALAAEHARAEKQHQAPPIQHVTKELKAIRYKETMRYVRRHLSPSERRLSSFIHTPSVEKVSEVGAKTIARPSGLLGGGLVALFGSVFTLYIARKYGFEVPNSLFAALFIGGFLLGLVGEFVVTGFTIRRRIHKHRKYGQV